MLLYLQLMMMKKMEARASLYETPTTETRYNLDEQDLSIPS